MSGAVACFIVSSICIEVECPNRVVRCSGLRSEFFSGTPLRPQPTMPSADFCTRIPTPLDAGSTRHARRSPRVLRTHLHAYACRIYVVAFRKFRALMIRATSPRYAASYPLPVRQASALPSASSRFAVARDTLAVQLTLPLVGRVEDLHLQVSAPCRAHTQKGPLLAAL